MHQRLSKEEYIQGILSGDRFILSRAITLVESRVSSDRQLAQEVLSAVLPHSGKAIRVGITGAPGVGKSTFIEAFGGNVTSLGKRLAVLTIDPSSPFSKGSILGDKTRMESLSRDPLAYIRPTAAAGALGGVGEATAEALLLCEAAGFDVIFVETVGVGQSETYVRETVDFFLLLILAGAGDELQGVKRGIMEMADALLVTKADGPNLIPAQLAQTEYQQALHSFPTRTSGWLPTVQTCSAFTGAGLSETWTLIENYVQITQRTGFFAQQRQTQRITWLHQRIRQKLEEVFYQNPLVQSHLPALEASVRAGELLPVQAASELLGIFGLL